MRRSLVVGLLLVACSRGGAGSQSTDAGPPQATVRPAITRNALVQGNIAGHEFRARSAVLVRSMTAPPKDRAVSPPQVLLFATEVSCARWAAAEVFEPHVRIRNLPNGDAPGRQQVWFDFCVRGDATTSLLDCRIQSNEAWLDLEAGSRKEGELVRGTFEARREPWVKPDENGALAGSVELVVCDAAKPGGLGLVAGDGPGD